MHEIRIAMGKEEAFNILVSVLAIALTLTFANAGMNVGSSQFIFLMATFTIAIGTGFILHELAHKFVAMRYGAFAAFQAWPAGLVMMLALAIVPQLLGWGNFPIFLAPGAVYIYARRIDAKQNGIISIAGPLTNIALAFVFFIIFLLFSGNEVIATVASLGTYANLFLAFFNLLPLYPLDGSKVMAWSFPIWLIASLFAFGSLLLLGFPVTGLLDLMLLAIVFSFIFRSIRMM